jgi:hypothetical protein
MLRIGVKLGQLKLVSDQENNWSLYDLIDQEIEFEGRRHWLDKCPDITPERLGEIVLECIEIMKQNHAS